MTGGKLINYKASPTARKFHQSKAFVRGILGPFGCLAGKTPVVTEHGIVPIEEIDRPMRVLSWCEKSNQFVFSLSGGAYPKGKGCLYRVVTQQGEFDADGSHRVLCADGIYRRVDTLALGQSVFLCSLDLEMTNDGSCHKLSLPSARHYSQKLVDYLGDCVALARQYGQLLLEAQDNVLGLSPSPAGAQELTYPSDLDVALRMGGFLARSQEHSHPCQLSCQQRTGGSAGLFGRPFLTWASYISAKPYAHSEGSIQGLLRSVSSLVLRLRDQLSSLSFRSYGKAYTKGNILAIEKKGEPEIFWDLQVLDTNNYVTADGMINHNSGKSVAMCWEIFMKAKEQEPGPDGIRRTRWIVARNTQPQLETTTIKTWLDWFPEEIFGKMSRKPPFTHNLKFGDVEAEVIFLALDKPEDVKKLLSFEVTGVFFNEAREMDYEVIAGATGRVGRYPSAKDGVGCTWSGIIMDTNPPTDDHWWYKMAEEQAWAVDKFGNPVDISDIPEEDRWEFWKQPSGLAPDGENLENLMQPKGWEKLSLAERRKHGRKYYERQLGGKTEEWINVYVHGNYGFIQHGQPVYKGAWNPDIHTAKDRITFPGGGTIYVGVDASGRHPAAVFLSKTLGGQIQVLHELCVTGDEGMGATSFARLLKSEMAQKFPSHDFVVFGDPAGAWSSQNDERTYFDILRANGIFIKPSPGLRIPERVETVIDVLSRNVQGGPALLVSPSCKQLLRGFNGGYRYRQLNTSGESRYDEKPEKNRYSDVQDALQYVLCGMGEMRKMYGRTHAGNKPTVFARSDYKTGRF